MILADKRDYRNGYKKHIAAYKLLSKDNNSTKSRCLLLVYAVECGLKYKLLEQWHEISTKNWIGDKDNFKTKVIKSHNLRKMLKELRQENAFHFPQMKTKHGDDVSTDTYHQFCRYGIVVSNKDKLKEMEYETILCQLAEWIGEEI